MPRRPIVLAAALVAVLAVQGCDTAQTSRAIFGAQEPGVIPDVQVSEFTRQNRSRSAQLQTPLERTPEETGAPAASIAGPDLNVDRGVLVAGGVNVLPSVRVWQRRPDGRGVQIFGTRAPEPVIYKQPVAIAED